MAIPIPHRPSGFTLGAQSADVTIDVFIDLQCPHSRQVWPTIIDILNHYKASSLSVTVHIITLSNHRQAWDVSLGVFALAQDNAQTAFDFISYVYTKQEAFYNAPFLDKTHQDLRELVVDLAADFSQIDRASYADRVQDYDIYIAARTPIRYAATKSVWATPTLFVNNADDVPVNHTASLDDWKALIDPLLDS